MRSFFLAGIILLAWSLPIEAGPCDELKSQIEKTYNFKPSKLTSAQVDSKSLELDKIWNMVEKNPNELLPCLRTEIRSRKSDTFFRFDASNLLIKLDNSPESKKLLIETYSEVDLADVDRRFWIPPLTLLARDGHDISKAAETWMRFPDPGYNIRGHSGSRISKDAGAIALFGSMDEAQATAALVRIASDQGSNAREIAYWLLIRQATDESDASVRKLIPLAPKEYADHVGNDIANPSLIEPRVGKPKATREVIIKALEELLVGKPAAWTRHTAEVPDGEKDMVAVLRKDDIPLIRKVRRYYAATPTALAPEWYQLFTQIINTLRKKGSPKGNSVPPSVSLSAL